MPELVCIYLSDTMITFIERKSSFFEEDGAEGLNKSSVFSRRVDFVNLPDLYNLEWLHNQDLAAASDPP